MKTSKTCPKCGSTKILYVVEVADKHDKGANPYDPAVIARVKMKGKIHGYGAGALEAYVCPQCGYCEHYVKDPDSIEVDGDTVHELTA